MKKVFANGRKSFYAKDEIIQVDDNIHYIVSGSIALFSLEAKNRSFLFLYKPGEIFPYVKSQKDLLSGRKLIYRAITPVTLLSLERSKFEAEAYKPENIKGFVGNLLEVMELQIERIDNLEQTRVYQKLIERLQFIAKRVGISDGERIIIETPISHSDIATSIGSTRETVNRFMKKLERSGVITIKNQAVIINSVSMLQQAGKGSDSLGAKLSRRIQLGGVLSAVLVAEEIIRNLQAGGFS